MRVRSKLAMVSAVEFGVESEFGGVVDDPDQTT